MHKSNEDSNECEDESFKTKSEYSNEYDKYIKKLELQRSILNKLIEADFKTMNEITAVDCNISKSL